ncbi:MAG TPA: bifunctional hydroxymethylpyrimidine kinase/phosphomethylpyrimidine kinase [Pyrinomonadaceae bacterium]|nr:bifunctional hydroxymethylpyrimidine kinase/phosphomethylpyrimidine kinase [Pyrinomonadaceae bacterium]
MSSSLTKKPVVLTIAGFDPSGRAGIVADIRTIELLGCAAVAAITSITFQNSETYFGAVDQTAQSVRGQIESMVRQNKIAAVKVGMLPTAEVVSELTSLISELNLPAPVIDPVMESSSGGKLMADDAFEVFVTELLPLARVVTPNIPEAEKFGGMNIRDEETMHQAAARIRELGARAVLIKGGHLQQAGARRQEAGEVNREATDLLDDDGEVTIYRNEWIEVPNVRGTGCMLSSAIAAGLARGDDMKQAVSTAKQFVSQAIKNSKLETRNSKPNPTRL